MTECERILEKGILPSSFFEAEIISDYYVDEKRKKIWAIELDLFIAFCDVCRKHNLKFWADGGTMLGAVRHKGFIPWDDDMDIIMPRSDYNKLLEIGPAEFGFPYFLQTPHTDRNYGYSFAKLRNSNTTCIPSVFMKSGFNHGIHIDIFPLDKINLDTYDKDRENITEHIMRCSSFMKRNSIELLDERQLRNYNKYFTENPAVEFDAINDICSKYKDMQTAYVSNCTNVAFKKERLIWKKEWFEQTKQLEFETITIPVPFMVEERLTAQYGDYLTLPPVEQRGTWHPNVIWDPDKSYLDHILSI